MTAKVSHLDDLRAAKIAIMHDVPMTIDQRCAVLELIGEAIETSRAVRVGWGALAGAVFEDVEQE